MSKPISLRLSLLPFVVLAATTLLAATDALGVEAAHMDRYTHSDGTSYYALSLKPTVAVKPAANHDVVVLVDTSASQVGKFRDKQLATLKAFLAELKPGDRVTILASDLETVPMGKVGAPGSQELNKAVAKLQERLPLGSTDLEKAIDMSLRSFDKNSKAKSLVYIGDGGSTANLLGTEKFGHLVDKLIDAQVPVTSYGIGPKIDDQVLGALAARTGGVVVDDDAQVAKNLAKASKGVVYWPKSAAVPGSRFSEIYPSKVPPLRADRDSVLVGTLRGEGPINITMKTITPEGERDMTWKVTPTESKKQNAYLANLVGWARQIGGTALPIVDSESLKLAKTVNQANAINLGELANQALAGHDTARAKALAEAVLRHNPNDGRAKAILVAADADAKEEAPKTQGSGDLNMVAEKPEPVDGSFARDYQATREVLAGQIEKDVQVTIHNAHRKLDMVPELAIRDLKVQMEMVRNTPDLDPDFRSQMIGKLSTALRQASLRQTEVEIERQQQAVKRARALERAMIVKNLERDTQKVNQLMKRFESLLAENRYREEHYRLAEEQVAVEAHEVAAAAGIESAIPSIATATRFARMARYHHDYQVLRIKRQKAIADTLASSEQSFVSFDDRQPILYPDPERWMAMSARRIKRYASMDLQKLSPSEQKIMDELDKPTNFDFFEEPLNEVVNTISDNHNGIMIKLDKTAIENNGQMIDTAITCQL
ncbi:MAG: VWA domain-containing protein, partial [Planctomycetia bacterium]